MNQAIFYFFYSFAHKFAALDDLFIFCALYLPYLVVVGAIVFLLFHHEVIPSENPLKQFSKKWKEVLLSFFVAGVAWCASKVLKVLIHIDRPFTALPNVKSLITESGYAFPSGHATFFMALGVAIFFSHKKAGLIFIALALIIGIARILVGVHYPTDVLGGFVLGGLIAYLVAYFLKNV